MESLTFEELDRSTRGTVRSLILDGLAERWGSVDESLNPDLDDMLVSYASGQTIVARDELGAVVGTGTVVPRGTGTAELVRMSVDRTSRRCGIGRQLVDELVAVARNWGCTTVVLETSTSWTDVIAFYSRCGFEITHVAKGEFGSDTWFELRLVEGNDES